jgi:hypothetical protein
MSREAALRVYLSHSLNAVKVAVDQLEERSGENRWRTAITFGQTLLRYIRTCLDEPQHWLCTISGIAALAAIDRAEEAFKWSMSPTANNNSSEQKCLRDLCAESGRAIVSAIVAQRNGETELAQVWLIANHLCDCLTCFPEICQKHYTYTSTVRLQRPARPDDSQRAMGSSRKNDPCRELWYLAELQQRRAWAFRSIAEKITIYASFVGEELSGLAGRYSDMEKRAEQASGLYGCALDFQELASTCTHAGIAGIWQAAVGLLSAQAAEVVTLPDSRRTAPVGSQQPNQQRIEAVKKKSQFLSNWASALFKLLPSVQSARNLTHKHPVPGGPLAALPALVTAVEYRLEECIHKVIAFAEGPMDAQTKEDEASVISLIESIPAKFGADCAFALRCQRQAATSRADQGVTHVLLAQYWSAAATWMMQSLQSIVPSNGAVTPDHARYTFARQRAMYAAELAEGLQQDTLQYWHNARRCEQASSPVTATVANIWRRVAKISTDLTQSNMNALECCTHISAYERHRLTERVEHMRKYVTKGAELARLLERTGRLRCL